jgi:hypothetical protein
LPFIAIWVAVVFGAECLMAKIWGFKNPFFIKKSG